MAKGNRRGKGRRPKSKGSVPQNRLPEQAKVVKVPQVEHKQHSKEITSVTIEGPTRISQIESNSCFYIAAMQAASAAILSINEISEQSCSIAFLAYKLLKETENVRLNLSNFIKVIKEKPEFSMFNFGQMDDSFLFLRSLVQSFQNETSEIYRKFTIERIVLNDNVSCKKCEITMTNKQYPPMYYLQNEITTVEHQMEIMLQKATSCGKCKSTVQDCITVLPDVLLLATPKEVCKVKINYNIQLQDKTYELVGVSCSNGIHAIAFSKRNDGWYFCDFEDVYKHQNPGKDYFSVNYRMPLGLVYLINRNS